ncbi:MAG: B12-binding domain-containing radical SAM protein [Phycisphaerae bacterium]|nr:B12-binding domain-containing radical SAM protein [Phycisphaerae bacterium]
MRSGSEKIKPSVVLVADRTLSASYKILFEGIFATMQTTRVPAAAMRYFLAPPAPTDSAGRAMLAPLGLRRIESSLLASGFSLEEVVITTPEALDRVLGPWTKVVGVSSSDPLGYGMSNTTTTSFWGGELYTRFWMRQLLDKIGRVKRQFGYKVIAGGPGAWQWRAYPDETAERVIDTVFEGYFEAEGPGRIRGLMDGRLSARHVVGPMPCVEQIRPIRGASCMGVVELSRGCGRGCRFCAMARVPMIHLPPEIICEDLRINRDAGVRAVVSGSEDFFRYGGSGVRPNVDALCGLLEKMRAIEGLSFLQIDHANISTVMQLSDVELRRIRGLMNWRQPTEFLWVNMGAESANGRLVAANSGGKIAPLNPDQWEDMIVGAGEKLTRTGFYGVFSLVLGLPGETAEDIRRTQALVDRLQAFRAVVFPIFYEPVDPAEIRAETRFGINTMRPEHLELYRKCYEINFRNVPRLFWDNQRAGGVSWIKRALMRQLGKMEIATWRRQFKAVSKRIASRSEPERARYAV